MSPQELVALLAAHWKRLFVVTVICGAIGYVAASWLPRYYRTEVVLAPATQLAADTAGLGGLASRLGGLASVAGIELGATGVNRETITLETLRGPTFLVDFARRRDLVVPLFAGRSYNAETGQWELDPDVYDSQKGIWTRPGQGYRHPAPSDFEIYRRMAKRVSVAEDRRTGIIRLTVESRSPQIAVQWASAIIKDLNEYMRDKDVLEARKTLDYLQEQVGTTQVAEMRSIFYKLIEEQTKILMLANARSEYALKVIDSPIKPDRPAWPRRGLLAVLAALAGFALATASLLIPKVLFSRPQGKVESAR